MKYDRFDEKTNNIVLNCALGSAILFIFTIFILSAALEVMVLVYTPVKWGFSHEM